MAHPGFSYIDAQGIIREKFFESNDLNRFTPNDVIVKLFPELAEQVNEKLGIGLVSENQRAPGVIGSGIVTSMQDDLMTLADEEVPCHQAEAR